MKDERFKDVQVRKALQMSVDKEDVQGAAPRNREAGVEHDLAATAAYDPNYKPYSYNPEKAKALLKDAGLASAASRPRSGRRPPARAR